jgi:hypothetical protein
VRLNLLVLQVTAQVQDLFNDRTHETATEQLATASWQTADGFTHARKSPRATSIKTSEPGRLCDLKFLDDLNAGRPSLSIF